MKKILKRKMIWDNVQFIPPRSNTWYRFYNNDGKCIASIIRKSNKSVQVSFFTSDGNIRGWSITVWEGYKAIAWSDFKNGDYIRDKRIGLVEDEALEWANLI